MIDQRARTLKEGEFGKGPVLYWMSRDQRVDDNWALIFSQRLAIQRKVPLLVVFCLAPRFLNATHRQYAFMLAGLEQLSRKLAKLNIPFYLVHGEAASVLTEFVRTHAICALTSDFDPLRIKKTWKKDVMRKIEVPFYEVDAHNIVPCVVASGKQEYSAFTIRKKMGRLLPVFLDHIPPMQKHPFSSNKEMPLIRWDGLVKNLDIDRRVKEVDWIAPGEEAAQRSLADFMNRRFIHYERDRNDPTLDGQSSLSPYLHFGQLSAQRVALSIEESRMSGSSKAAFLEELVIRRELSDNFCYYNEHYDSFDGFAPWAQKTLNDHREDRRSYLYSLDQFESGQTHDELWNAAQMEMVKKGKMHGYMRMYWAKKILEWTPSPETAMEYAIYLNDRYELDGRDPNGYAGIAWSIGGVHDRAFRQRNVFGKIRFMSYNGCASKFDIKRYIEKVRSL
ncbi:MAG TPA: deoxyribodipyrimidine photo-lyase [Syntrophorhabdaceae bacterium]|nr:deoxyribodipyrimidine photo-lyase [Syntrophorhabdaceae bacterium]